MVILKYGIFLSFLCMYILAWTYFLPHSHKELNDFLDVFGCVCLYPSMGDAETEPMYHVLTIVTHLKQCHVDQYMLSKIPVTHYM